MVLQLSHLCRCRDRRKGPLHLRDLPSCVQHRRPVYQYYVSPVCGLRSTSTGQRSRAKTVNIGVFRGFFDWQVNIEPNRNHVRGFRRHFALASVEEQAEGDLKLEARYQGTSTGKRRTTSINGLPF